MLRRRFILVIVALALLAGCSTRFVYEQLDWLIVWRVGKFVSLTDEQKSDLREDVREHLEFVRVNEMPRAAAMLNELAASVAANEFDRDDIDSAYQQMLALSDEFLLGIVPMSANLLMQLDEEQKQELFENLDEINDEMYETYSGASEEERRKNRNKSTVRGIKRFTGRLNDQQKEMIYGALANMEDASEQWIEYQREWQRRFRSLIDEVPPRAEFEARLTDLFVYPRNFHSQEYRARVDQNRRIMNNAAADLVDSLSDVQRRRAVEKLKGYAERLTLLANYR